MCVCLHVCMSPYASVVPMKARIVSDPLELESQTTVSCPVVVGNQSLVLCKSRKCSY